MSDTKSSKSSNIVFIALASLLAVGLRAAIVMRRQSQQKPEPFNNATPVGGKELSSRYFTRFYIPVILSVLAIAFLIVLLTISPGLPLNALSNI